MSHAKVAAIAALISIIFIGSAVAGDDLFPASPDFGLIVEFRDPPLVELTGGDVRAAMAGYQATFKRFHRDVASILQTRSVAAFEPPLGHEYHVVFNGLSLIAPREAIPAIRQLPYVKRVYRDQRVQACATPPHVTQVGADRVWSTTGNRGRGIVVAILDTGVDYRHPALGGGMGPGFKVLGGYDVVNKKADPMDDQGHGTLSAGIVAADSAVAVGVAPDASLLAYKVLDSQGLGKSSDVIAGLERTVDPNGDGDLRDHADVANLSLGGAGGPDDAQSLAVDRATAAGVVVVVSAGNTSSFHGVLSPSTARTAISVGAAEGNDTLSSISSKGPSPRTAAIKPDVLAPANGVSTALNGGYLQYGGTSMAAPIVAGTAALVKFAHRDWTPAQIKSAIINSAAPVNGEVMARGSGRVDAFRAAGSAVLLEPSSVSLGLDPVSQATWSPTATVRLTNRGSQPVTYNVAAPPITGVSVTASPSITVGPGATADLPLSFAVTNAAINPTTDSFSFGGDLTLTSTGAPAEVLRVPWAAVKAARATVTYDKEFPDSVWVNRTSTANTSTWRGISADEYSSEALLRPGTYDVMLVWEDFDPAYPRQFELGKYSRLREAHLFYIDAQNLNGDTTVTLRSSQARHTVTMDGRDGSGRRLGQSGFNHVSTGLIIFPPSPPCTNGCLLLRSVPLPPFGTHVWKFGDITEQVLMIESDYDVERHAQSVIQHGMLNGVRADATLTSGGTALKRVTLGMYQFPGTDRDVVVSMVPFRVQGGDNGPQVWGNTLKSDTDVLNLRSSDGARRRSCVLDDGLVQCALEERVELRHAVHAHHERAAGR